MGHPARLGRATAHHGTGDMAVARGLRRLLAILDCTLKVKWRQGSREAEPKITAANTDKRLKQHCWENTMPITSPVCRRTVLGTVAPLGLALFSRLRSQARAGQLGLRFGPPEPFSFEGLVERARQLAARPYVPPPMPTPEAVQQIDYDAHHKLQFKPSYALFGDGPGNHRSSSSFSACSFPNR